MKLQTSNHFRMKLVHTAAGLLAGWLTLVPFTGQAQDGGAIFNQACKACHTIGGGRVVGPDLKGVTSKRSADWLLKWTKSSQALVNAGDADAVAIFNEFNKITMPDQNFTDAEIQAVYAYIDQQTGTAAEAAPAAPAEPAVAAAPVTQQTIDEGRDYFTGARAFSAGGVACIACHNVNYAGVIPGGLLAKDLTTAHSRMGGDAGLGAILNAPPFPAMTEAYKTKPLTAAEVTALSAFLATVDKDTQNQVATTGNILLFGGLAALVGLLVIIFGLWFIRKKDTVKKGIYDRQIKSI